MSATSDTEYLDTVVVGGGQAGLAAGYFLEREGQEFVILDGSKRMGEAYGRDAKYTARHIAARESVSTPEEFLVHSAA